MRAAPPIEEAPVARAGPRSPDVFYRGEEAGAALKATDLYLPAASTFYSSGQVQSIDFRVAWNIPPNSSETFASSNFRSFAAK